MPNKNISGAIFFCRRAALKNVVTCQDYVAFQVNSFHSEARTGGHDKGGCKQYASKREQTWTNDDNARKRSGGNVSKRKETLINL